MLLPAGSAGSGAVWNLTSNHLRPDGWTSADAAGLPVSDVMQWVAQCSV